MSVLIKGLIMPSCCDGCTFSDWSNLHQTSSCKLHDYDPCFADHSRECTDKRADFCPLVEIPEPHGDLIDRDALLDMVRDVNTDYYCEVLGVTVEDIDSVPTVIEAEGKNDERMDDWTCDGCKHRHVLIYAYPCSECHEGSKYTEEGSENE